ncbi:dehydrogenase [Nocardia panacis]|uniref:Dehydrogenase n=1 Tax=Nocardia panacis TaxID=2340916 RepID=A0A3A4KV74_9NOCA|nr:FAD-dependent oxidoreductase [Nocardia panacis]RJO73764.1 dehydrogenase [Nocardia panacis]
MLKILVAGGGFAGVWSAASAVRLARGHGVSESELSVTLVSDQSDLVLRPRLYEADPGSMRVPLARILDPIGVEIVNATVRGIDPSRRRIRTEEGGSFDYDRLVLATGSRLFRPTLPGIEFAHDVDTVDGALALDAHLHRLPEQPASPGRFTAVVVGAGFTGLEVATELVDRLRAIAAPHGLADEVRVVLLDRADVVAQGFAPDARAEIVAALDQLGVRRRLGVSLRAVSGAGVELADGTHLAAETVVWAGGVRVDHLAADITADRDAFGRLAVDEFLRTAAVPEIFAAGDTAAAPAEEGNTVTQSCQHAMPMGKFAGHNAAADLLGLPLAPFRPNPFRITLDLGSAGAVRTVGWDRALHESGPAAKEVKRAVNSVWIYPPVDDAAELLRQADFRVSARRPVTAEA